MHKVNTKHRANRKFPFFFYLGFQRMKRGRTNIRGSSKLEDSLGENIRQKREL
jgi:hypothetical protein